MHCIVLYHEQTKEESFRHPFTFFPTCIICNVPLCTFITKIKISMGIGSSRLSSLELLEKPILLLLTMIWWPIVQIENQTHFLHFHQNRVCPRIWNSLVNMIIYHFSVQLSNYPKNTAIEFANIHCKHLGLTQDTYRTTNQPALAFSFSLFWVYVKGLAHTFAISM